MTFVPDMTATLFAPFTRNPCGSTVGRTPVGTLYPYIAMAVVAVIARDPYVAFARCGNNFNGTRRGWADADNNLCVGGADSEKEGAGCGEKLFLHVGRSPEYSYHLGRGFEDESCGGKGRYFFRETVSGRVGIELRRIGEVGADRGLMEIGTERFETAHVAYGMSHEAGLPD
jgi:hypothetical protein